MSPLPKLPAYGDSSKLEQLASGTKQQNGTYGPVVQKRGPGRPATGQAQQSSFRVSDEQKAVFSELAQAEAVRQQWQVVAQQSPTPYVQGMLEVADRNYQAIAAKAYNITPNQTF
jgi:hypothetical protein